MRSTLLAAFSVAGLLGACNEPFDARAPLDDQMVVFSVLSTDRTTQIVRVQESYMPSGFDPMSYTTENSLKDAIVSINTTNGSSRMRDTLLELPDTSRYKSSPRAYVLNPFTPQFGATYEIVVQSAHHGVASASVIVPNQSKVTISSTVVQVLDRPNTSSLDTRIVFVAQLSGNSKGYVCRLYLYYDVLKGTRWVEERVEVPITSSDSSSYSLDFPRYPRLAVTPATSQVGLIYRNGYYRGIINKVNSQYRSNRLIFKWATFVVLQADKNLFQYYGAIHADQDPYSIRLDERMVSSVDGALGMVGAYSLDSLVNLLPSNFWGNR